MRNNHPAYQPGHDEQAQYGTGSIGQYIPWIGTAVGSTMPLHYFDGNAVEYGQQQRQPLRLYGY